MTTQPKNKDKAEQKIAKDELSEKELEKAIGGTGSLDTVIKSVGEGLASMARKG